MTAHDDPWQTLNEDPPLLHATYGRERVAMTAMGLREGGFVVHSPGTRSAGAQRALEKRGEVRYLLAPNHFHNAGLADWQSAFPGARVVAAPRAHARLRKQVPSLQRVEDLAGLAAALPVGARVFGPPMAKQGETWLALHVGELRALVVCDAIVNMSQVKWPFWVLGFRAQLMTNPFFKRLFLKDKSAYRAWLLAELEAQPPNLFIPCHGDFLRGPEVADRLKRVTREA